MEKLSLRERLMTGGKMAASLLGATLLIVGLAGCGNSTSSSSAAAKPQSSQNTQKDSSPPATTEKDVEADYEEDVDDFELGYYALEGTSWIFDDTELEFTDEEVGTFSVDDGKYEIYTLKVYVWDGDEISYTEEGQYSVLGVAPIVDDGELTWETLDDDVYFLMIDSDDDQFKGGFYISYDDGELRLDAMEDRVMEALDEGGIVWPGNLGGEAGDNDGTVWLTRYI